MEELGALGKLGLILLLFFVTTVAQAQIKIGGNVYGGGNHAEVRGSTKVTVKAGDIGAVMDPNASRPVGDLWAGCSAVPVWPM